MSKGIVFSSRVSTVFKTPRRIQTDAGGGSTYGGQAPAIAALSGSSTAARACRWRGKE